MKDTCKKCRYWTHNKEHAKFKCYTGRCPAKQRDKANGNVSRSEKMTVTAPTYLNAIRVVGRAMGDRKFGNHMMGSMMPSGELDVAEVIALLYKKPVASVRRSLAKAEKAEFERKRS